MIDIKNSMCLGFIQTWMFADAALYDVGDVFERGRILLHHVVTQGHIVREVRLVSQNLHSGTKLLTSLIIAILLCNVRSRFN